MFKITFTGEAFVFEKDINNFVKSYLVYCPTNHYTYAASFNKITSVNDFGYNRLRVEFDSSVDIEAKDENEAKEIFNEINFPYPAREANEFYITFLQIKNIENLNKSNNMEEIVDTKAPIDNEVEEKEINEEGGANTYTDIEDIKLGEPDTSAKTSKTTKIIIGCAVAVIVITVVAACIF